MRTSGDVGAVEDCGVAEHLAEHDADEPSSIEASRDVEEGIGLWDTELVVSEADGLSKDGLWSDLCKGLACAPGNLLVVRPGYNLPVYAPRIILSSSDSPGCTASRLLLRISVPNTIARCSLLSASF